MYVFSIPSGTFIFIFAVGVPVKLRTAFLPSDTAAFVNVRVRPVVALTATDSYPAIAC